MPGVVPTPQALNVQLRSLAGLYWYEPARRPDMLPLH